MAAKTLNQDQMNRIAKKKTQYDAVGLVAAGVIVSSSVAAKYNVSPGDTVDGLTVSIKDWSLDILVHQ